MKNAEKREVKNRLNQLSETMDNYVRTERHLEQHSDIGSRGNLENAREIQEVRRNEMENLKNKITYGGDFSNQSRKEEAENLKENYIETEGYINHNAENMTSEDLNNLKQKQKNRKRELDRMF
ncbi:hypothetical protein [Hathewaya massiliensis]|uniref:hypothetical protein n=1 Tax=Hathewaya massiliensis TaxID=1964382 RepID=UPI00115957E2|nr:hypothetical protein [Hathewaya massiliensis]